MRAGALGAALLLLACAEHPTLEPAYRAQDRSDGERFGRGAEVAGFKLAFTSPSAQRAWGAEGPAFAPLFKLMRVAAGASVAAGNYSRLMAEVEIALRLERDLAGPGVSPREAAEAVAAAHVALELPDNRFGQRPSVPELIADGLGARRFALGPPVDPAGLALGGIECRLSLDGRELARGSGRDALGGPYRALGWLAAELANRGRSLSAGQIVLTGSIGRPYVAQGDPAGLYRAECAGLGSVELSVGSGRQPAALRSGAGRGGGDFAGDAG